MSEKDPTIRQLRLNRKLILSLLVVFTIAVVTSLVLVSDYFSSHIYTKKLEKLRADNAVLVNKIQENEARLSQLIDQLESIKFQDNLLRDLVKLPKIHDDVREVGVGGTQSMDEESSLEYLLPGDDHGLYEQNSRIDHVNRVMNLESLSYAEILEKAEGDAKRFRCFPAIHPVDTEKTRLTSDFGMRPDPINRKQSFHDGHDFAGRTGTPVHATADGVVKASKYYGTFGNYIEIDHGYGYKTVYGHMYRRNVKAGEKISRGDLIGAIGNTGKSTAPHLHYGVKYQQRDMDPEEYYFDLKLN